MRFGNTLASIRGGIVAMTLLGVLAFIAVLVLGVRSHSVGRVWPIGALFILLLPGGFLLVCLPTLAFSVRMEEGRVRHVLLDRWILSDFPVGEFVSTEMRRGPWAMVIRFTGNRSIRFLGAHLGTIGALRAALEHAKEQADRT